MKFLTGLVVTTLLFGASVNKPVDKTDEPKYAPSGALLKPDNYRQWTWLSSGLGMAYVAPGAGGESKDPSFDNVFVTPSAYRSFLETGRWPDKTMFMLEVRSSVTHHSINEQGHSQGDIVHLEVHVKDEKRFTRKWAFFSFAATTDHEGKQFADTSDCYTCHEKSGALDSTFAQFYPTVRDVANQKGTLRPVQ